MNQIGGTFQDGHVILDRPVDWPDGTRIEVSVASESFSELTVEEFDALVDELCDIVDGAVAPNTPPFSDQTVSRQGLYSDHL